jgi:hypothetical protein
MHRDAMSALLDGDQVTVHTYERRYVFGLSER